ncbi:hypothetical protein PV355_01705 [Streptomyces stelliscabiei]|uniref:hypothetical protein n=1 Tax=Streptomyces stelliscabiei TaxID=146820 RepID=UPI0029A2870E|nr:hypothetical protein [Streptomyces stelliscabiei]MDX2513882.1 hypothetical protein [Streptomyces stelliscabiei]
MNPEQIPSLLKQVSYADPRLLPNDPHELMGLAALWARVLADVPADYALHAVGEHYAASPYPIKPSDIADRWRTTVRDRMRKHTGTFEPTAHPDLDPDDVDGYLGALRTEYQAVITGQAPPTPLRAITSRDVQEDDIRVMRQQQDLKAFMKQSIAQARQDNERRRKLVARYPDLNDEMHALPGHAMWSGSVGGNTKTAAIVAEAEHRAATEQNGRAA